MELVAPADIGISVAVYDVGRQPTLARFFESPEPARLAKYSIVLTNESTKHIVGIAMRWVLTNQNGQTRTTRSPLIVSAQMSQHGSLSSQPELS